MMENQAKEKLIEMKAEPEQGEKLCRERYLVRLGVGNPRLGVDVCLGVELARLGEPTINKKAPEDSSLVHLSVEVSLGVAFLRLGVVPPSADEDTCLCLGVA